MQDDAVRRVGSAAPVTEGQGRGHHVGVEALGVDAVLGLEADDQSAEHRGEDVGRCDGSHQAVVDPRREALGEPVMRLAGPGPHGLGHLGVARGAQPQLALEQQEAAGLVARVRHHVGGDGPQAVLDGGCQFEFGGDDRHQGMGPLVEQRQEQALLRAEVGVDRTRGAPGRVGHGVDGHGVDAPLGEQAGGRVEKAGPGVGLSLLLGSWHRAPRRTPADCNLDSRSYLSSADAGQVGARRPMRYSRAAGTRRAGGVDVSAVP